MKFYHFVEEEYFGIVELSLEQIKNAGHKKQVWKAAENGSFARTWKI